MRRAEAPAVCLRLLAEKREARHPESRTAGPFVQQTPKLLEGHGVPPLAELPPRFSAARERAERRQGERQRRGHTAGAEEDRGPGDRVSQRRGGESSKREEGKKETGKGERTGETSEKTERGTRKEKEEKATGPSGHRDPGPGELLAGFRRECFEAGTRAPGRQ